MEDLAQCSARLVCIGLALITLALLIAGIHRTGRRWASGQAMTADGGLNRVAANERPQFVWKARWTASVIVALLLIFTAGISVVGVVHQAVWMMTGEESLVASNRFEFVGRLKSKHHLKSIGEGLHNYAEAMGSLPSGGTFDSDGRPLHSAMTMILPFIEQQALFANIDLQQPWNGDRNRKVFESAVPIYQFPAGVPNPELASKPGEAPGFALSNYAGNTRVLRLGQSMSMSDISDGTSNTILFGEVNEGLRHGAIRSMFAIPRLESIRGPRVSAHRFPRAATCCSQMVRCYLSRNRLPLTCSRHSRHRLPANACLNSDAAHNRITDDMLNSSPAATSGGRQTSRGSADHSTA